MQRALFNRATMRVADTTEVSGRVTADSIKDGLSAKKQSDLLRICTLAIFGCVVSVGVLACLAPIPVLAQGQQGNQGQGDQGQFVDPIVGSWLVHATIDNPPPLFTFIDISAFLENGIIINSDLTVGTAYGVWKRSGPPRTYNAKFLFVVPPGLGYPPGTIQTGLPGPLVLNPQGTQMTGPFHGFDTGPDGTLIDQFSGTAVLDRISFSSTP
jgi:hypothetical protein